MQKNQDYERRK